MAGERISGYAYSRETDKLEPVRVPMSEKELQEAVLDLAALLKWRVAHFRPGLTQSGNWRTPVAADGKGFVDLVMVRDRVLFVELKSAGGKRTIEQDEWMVALCAAGAEYQLWYPAQWHDGTIERTLR